MSLDLHAEGIELTTDLRDQIERSLSFALARFDSHIIRTTIHLVDVNGPKGGVDKQCKIVVQVRGQQPVVVEEIDASISAAVDRAADRASQAVHRAVDRTRQFDRVRAGSAEPLEEVANKSI